MASPEEGGPLVDEDKDGPLSSFGAERGTASHFAPAQLPLTATQRPTNVLGICSEGGLMVRLNEPVETASTSWGEFHHPRSAHEGGVSTLRDRGRSDTGVWPSPATLQDTADCKCELGRARNSTGLKASSAISRPASVPGVLGRPRGFLTKQRSWREHWPSVFAGTADVCSEHIGEI